MDIPPGAQKQLEAWTKQRDEILLDISVKTTEKEKKTQEVKALGLSHQQIISDISRAEGRLEEINKLEETRKTLVSVEISELEKQKVGLENQIPGLYKEVKVLELQKESVKNSISILLTLYESVSGKVSDLNKIVEELIQTGSKNIGIFSEETSTLISRVQEILQLSTENIEKHNQILYEIPKLFVELKRKSMEREIINKN